jgi:hypothetical protein
METKTKSSLKDFELFFGDPKGIELVQAMYNGEDYKTAGPTSSLMIELLRADNYKKKNYVSSCENNMIQDSDDVPQDVTDAIITIALFHKSIVGTVDPDEPTTSKNAVVFFNNLHKMWLNMCSTVRNFYFDNVMILAKVGSKLYDDANDPNRGESIIVDWVRLTDAEIDTLFTNNQEFTNDQLKNLRIYLMEDSSDKVLFGQNLPDVPKDINVWYTQSDGNFANIVRPPVSFLRDLYNATYKFGVVAGDIKVTYDNPAHEITLHKIESDFNLRPKKEFCLDRRKFFENVIKRDEQKREEHKEKMEPSSDIDYPFLKAYDMVYGKIWTYDTEKKMYYRLDQNNQRQYYNDEAKGNAKTCYATYLAKDKPDDCLRIIRCIIDGNFNSLKRCLTLLNEHDLWKVAEDDVKKVGPDMIRLVLRKFNVKGCKERTASGEEYLVPISFEQWKRDVMEKADIDPNVKNSILNNTKLLEYLQSLIAICRSNPNIINKNVKSIISRDTTPDYMKQLNIRPYTIPQTHKKSQYEFYANALRNLSEPSPITQATFAPLLSGNFSNVMWENPNSTYMQPMMGGHSSVSTLYSPYYANMLPKDKRKGIFGSSSQFSHLLEVINNAYTEVGLKLHPDDQKKIEGAISKIEELENKLARLFSVLVSIVKLSRFHGISLENIDRSRPVTMKLSDLSSSDNIDEFVRGYVKEITENMMSNMTVQQGISYELFNKVTPLLLNEATGKTENLEKPNDCSTKLFDL